MKNFSIKKKLYLLILVTFIPMTIYQSFKIYSEFEKSIELEFKSNQDFAEALGVSFNNYIERLWDNELSIGLAVAYKDTANADVVKDYMKSLMENQPTIEKYAWVDVSTKKIVASSDPKEIGVSLEGREYINKIINGQNKVISDMLMSNVGNEPIFVVARGIRKDNALKGIVIAIIDINELGRVLPPKRTSSNSFFGLLDSQGVFVFRNGVPDIARKMISVKNIPMLKHVLKGKVVKIRNVKSPVTGKKMMGVNLPIKDTGWVSYANTSYDDVLAKTFVKIRSELMVLLFIVVLGMIVIFVITRQIVEPISILKASAIGMAKGNLNIRTNIKGTDEIALAAQAFDQMAASIEQYDSLKTQFFSNLSHEFRTPLNIILSSIQLIESASFSEEYYDDHNRMLKYLPTMKQNCYRLLRLIDNLIDITRLDSGFLKFHFTNKDIVGIVEDITLSVANYTKVKGIEVIFDTDVEERIIGCDPNMIERIMFNLLSNSIKFTPSGGNIFVNIFNKEDKILISVRDTGIGIPSDKLPIIFERFRQVDSSLHREHEGSGIGLSLVKSIVEGLNGSIRVESELGKGTEFIIEMPVVLVEDDSDLDSDVLKTEALDKTRKIDVEFSDIYK